MANKRAPKKLKPDSVEGRPVSISSLDLPKLEALMRLKPTLEDTAAFFQCSATTISDTIKKHFGITFREFRDQRMVHTRLALQRKAVQMGESGNVAMLIFTLKNLCGWADKQEISGRDGGPIETSHRTPEEIRSELTALRVKQDK